MPVQLFQWSSSIDPRRLCFGGGNRFIVIWLWLVHASRCLRHFISCYCSCPGHYAAKHTRSEFIAANESTANVMQHTRAVAALHPLTLTSKKLRLFNPSPFCLAKNANITQCKRVPDEQLQYATMTKSNAYTQGKPLNINATINPDLFFPHFAVLVISTTRAG